jgi:diguanylate cyclase (GGDEF)-like protein/PAS domain S-box-containing protein
MNDSGSKPAQARAARYLSIKWQAFGWASLVLLSIFAAFLYFASAYSERQFELKLNQAFQQSGHQLDGLVEHYADQLIETSHTAARNSLLGAAVGKIEHGALARLASELSWTLLIQAGVESISIYDSARKLLANEGGFAGAELAEIVLDSESAQWRIQCAFKCYIEAGAPILVDGELRGALLLTEPLSNALLRFYRISNVDTALFSQHSKALEFNEFVEPWQKNLIASTRPEVTQELIRQASLRYTFSQLKDPLRLISVGDEYFQMRLWEIAGNDVLLIRDVSEEVAAADSTREDSFQISLLLMLLAECAMLLVLWGPLNRLRSSAGLVPLLAEGIDGSDFEQSKAPPSRLFDDESDLLRVTAFKLQNKMTSLNTELSVRENLLEDRGRELEQQRDLLDQLLNSVGAVIVILNESGVIELVNRTALKLSGRASSELIGRPFTDLLEDGIDRQSTMARLGDLVAGSLSEYEHEGAILARNGNRAQLAWRHAVLYEFDSERRQILSIAVDVSARIKSESEAAWLANHDSATGLYNRRRFEEDVSASCALAARTKAPVAVMVVDIESYDSTLSSLGSARAEELLGRVANIMRNTGRASDCLGKLERGRFAVLLRPIDQHEADQIIERYAKQLRAMYLQGNELCQSRIGLAYRSNESGDDAVLLAKAERALMVAKDKGAPYYVAP